MLSVERLSASYGQAQVLGQVSLAVDPGEVLTLVGRNGAGKLIGHDVVVDVQDRILAGSRDVFTAEVVSDVIEKTLQDVFAGDRVDLVSIGLLIALWSGSRALNVFIDTCSIMYGLGGVRGIVAHPGPVVQPVRRGAAGRHRRAPARPGRPVPARPAAAGPGGLPQLALLGGRDRPVGGLADLAVPRERAGPDAVAPRHARRAAHRRHLVRRQHRGALDHRRQRGGTSIYGPLATPIVLLIWLYVLSIAMHIGAALNATVESVWPGREILEARRERRPATCELKASPGMETGEVELPPNRTPPAAPSRRNPVAGTRDPR